MAGTVKLPVIGEVKTGYAVAGVAAVVGIVGYAYLQHKKSAAAAAAAASTASSTSAQIDPATGYPYGSPEDQAALAAQQGYFGGGGGGYGGYYPYGGGGGPGVPGGGSNVGVPQIVGSSQANAIAAIQAAGLVPFPSSVEAGMGNVTSQSPAAGSQVAIGSTVYWQAGPGGGGGNVTVPNVVGQEVDAAQRALAAVPLTWTRPPLKPGVGYKVTAQNPAAGAQVASGSAVALSIAPNTK